MYSVRTETPVGKKAEILLNGYGKQRIQDIIFIGSLPDICSGRGTGLSLYYPGCDGREVQEERLRMEANRDGLTQIGNRHYFLEKAGDMLKEESSLTFCYCDLDHLKYINDQYGHTEGDWYITFFVETIQKTHPKRRCVCKDWRR